MKIAVSAEGNTLESPMDLRFGRAAYFIIMDEETGNFEAADNHAASFSGGAGIATAQMIVDKGVEAVITGNVGPNAMNVLRAGEVAVYKGSHVSVQENVEHFKKGALEKIVSTVPAHFGMGGQGRQG